MLSPDQRWQAVRCSRCTLDLVLDLSRWAGVQHACFSSGCAGCAVTAADARSGSTIFLWLANVATALGRNAAPDVFKRAVRDAVVCTHVHPEGVEGALAQAAAVAALSLSTPTSERRCQHVDDAGFADVSLLLYKVYASTSFMTLHCPSQELE